MAANLDIRNDGVAAVVSIGETPWHKQGTIKLDRTSIDAQRLMTNLDATMEAAGLDFSVQKMETFFRRPVGDSGDTVEVRAESAYAVVRTDRWTPVGNVGEDFTCLQNAEAFAPARPILEQGLATVETAGALDGGADVWLLLRLVPSKLLEAAERRLAKMLPAGSSIVRKMDALDSYLSEVLPFAHFSNHHGGRRAATVQETGIRVVCQNTQSAALDGNAEGIRTTIRHTGDVAARYAEAVDKLMGDLAVRYMSLADARIVLQSRTLSQDEFERLVLETAVPVKHLESKIRMRESLEVSARTQSAIDKNHRIRDEIHALWTNGKGHTGDSSAWEAYQGLVEFVDHSDNARHGSSRLDSLRTGTLGRIKSRVYGDLVELAAESFELPGSVIGG